ncbi:rhomboid family intramembrane serine protease [Radiobacillus sp. PE A8.2]|uniref:rhomboid family intramembrane serine protease n=1 Tax=Radiobacillus sp. PE A8.2 TaxID=3380349 RepID=UPI00388E41F7
MLIKQEYFFFRLCYDLVGKHGFDIMHIDKDNKEIWMEKKTNKTAHVVRLYLQGFDWKNHLKNDIAKSIYKVKTVKRLLMGKAIKIHNVYIAAYPPVDSWEPLKKTIVVKDRKPTEMKVYYLDNQESANEKSRLYQDLAITESDISYPNTEVELEQAVHYLKTNLITTYNKKREETQGLFTNGKPLIAYVILAVNVLLFLLLEINGGSTSVDTLIEFGAKYNPAILSGEWWRIFTSMFLHIGLLHLVLNMIFLIYVGSVVERIYGNARFAIIYLLAGILGGLTSFSFNSSVSAGASGALFGLMGALLFFGVNYRKVFFQTMGWNIILVVGLNVLIGFSIPQIDNGAHLGGLIGGFIAAAIVFFPKKKIGLIQGVYMLVYAVIAVSLWMIGFSGI